MIHVTGATRDIAEDLGCAFTDKDVVNVAMEMSGMDVYATEAMVLAEEWQAVISTCGAAAVLNILTKKDEHFHDFDIPADAE